MNREFEMEAIYLWNGGGVEVRILEGFRGRSRGGHIPGTDAYLLALSDDESDKWETVKEWLSRFSEMESRRAYRRALEELGLDDG